MSSLIKPLTVLWVGGGQDSTDLLYQHVYNKAFNEQYVADSQFVAIMSDTGNEYPDTYAHVQKLQGFCERNDVEFYHITPNMGYHGNTWHSLQAQYERNDNIMSVGFPKSCTDNLKIKVCYNFLGDYLRSQYEMDGKGKRVFYQYAEQFGKLRSLIGFAKGEESRCSQPAQLDLFPEMVKDARPVWMRKSIEHQYPLIAQRKDRAACQEYIRFVGHDVPMPSNCMMCPFQNDAELVYLERFHPIMWQYWVQREQAKIDKNAEKQAGSRNLGVKGEKLLPEALVQAKLRYGHYSDAELRHYKMSHGHCVKSKI